MPSSAHHTSRSFSAGALHRVTPSPDIATRLRYLVRSAEPAVVFSSLAHLCVPTFSDACIVDIVEQGQVAYRIAHHPGDMSLTDITIDPLSKWSVVTRFADGAVGNDRDREGGYAGVMIHLWRHRCASSADQARAAVLARHAVNVVTEERRLADPHRGSVDL
jgi:hypothetical protein